MKTLYRALEAACAAYASLNLSLLHYITLLLIRTHLLCVRFHNSRTFLDIFDRYVYV